MKGNEFLLGNGENSAPELAASRALDALPDLCYRDSKEGLKALTELFSI